MEEYKPYYIRRSAEYASAEVRIQSHGSEKQPCIFEALHPPRKSDDGKAPYYPRKKPSEAVKPSAKDEPDYITEYSHFIFLSLLRQYFLTERLNSD